MKNSRNIKTVDLIEALRRCSTPGVHCDGCVFCSDEDHEEPWCGDVLLQEAVRRLEEYTDRCARYAEEIAVRKAAGERVEWIPVTERLPQEDGSYLVTTNYFGKHQGINIRCFAKDGETVDEYDLAGQKYVWYFYDSEYGCVSTDSVTHWMPLPEAPKGE